MLYLFGALSHRVGALQIPLIKKNKINNLTRTVPAQNADETGAFRRVRFRDKTGDKRQGARPTGFQATSKDQEILEEGGGAGPSLLPRRDHE